MTHVVILESNSRTGMLAVETAQELGWRTTFLRSQKLWPLYRGGRTDEILGRVDELIEIASSFDVDLLSKTLEAVNARNPVDALVTCVEYCTVPLAQAAERTGLRFTRREAVENARSKRTCRAILDRHGIASARFGTGHTPDEMIEAAAHTGYPLIAKPVSGWGSLLASYVRDEAELAAYYADYEARLPTLRDELQGTLQGGILIEQYLDGRVFSVEMGAQDGRVIPFMISEGKRSVEVPTMPLGTTMPADLTPAESDGIFAYVASIIDALGFDIGICHAELALTSDGPRLIEFNPRVMGSSLPLIYRSCTGKNIYEYLLRIHAGQDIGVLPARYRCAVSSRTIAGWEDGTIRPDLAPDWLDAIRDELIACQIDAKAGQAISGLKRNFFDSLGFIQVAADTPRESAIRGDRMAQRISGILGVEPCR